MVKVGSTRLGKADYSNGKVHRYTTLQFSTTAQCDSEIPSYVWCEGIGNSMSPSSILPPSPPHSHTHHHHHHRQHGLFPPTPPTHSSGRHPSAHSLPRQQRAAAAAVHRWVWTSRATWRRACGCTRRASRGSRTTWRVRSGPPQVGHGLDG